MRNIRFLKKHQPYKKTTEYAVFFDHEDIYARLDFEISDHADLDHAQAAVIMIDQLENDLNDKAAVDEIRKQNEASVKGERIRLYLAEGFEEVPATEFKAEAIKRLGSE